MSRKSIAETLKEKRKAAGLSVDQVLAVLSSEHDIDISSKTLYSYESGHRQPDADTLMSLCHVYGISDVLEAFGYKKEEPATNDELSAEEKLFMSLPHEVRQDVLKYMRFLAEQEARRE